MKRFKEKFRTLFHGCMRVVLKVLIAKLFSPMHLTFVRYPVLHFVQENAESFEPILRVDTDTAGNSLEVIKGLFSQFQVPNHKLLDNIQTKGVPVCVVRLPIFDVQACRNTLVVKGLSDVLLRSVDEGVCSLIREVSLQEI